MGTGLTTGCARIAKLPSPDANSMKPKFFSLLEKAIEEGIDYGWRRAHKHVETPSEGTLKEEISNAIFSSLHDYFTFDEEDFS